MQNETRYPLSWPIGWKRTEPARRRLAQFAAKPSAEPRKRELTVSEATAWPQRELDLLGVGHPILSSNLELRLDGLPRSGQREPDDPGAAVYFTLKRRRTVLACDRWERLAENIAAIAAHVEALRGIERCGIGTMEPAFRGYQAIEDFTAGVPRRRVLGVRDDAAVTLAEVEARFRKRARECHPDHGGSHEAMAGLNQESAAARRELRKRSPDC